MKFDDIVRVIGECGPYQRRIYFLLCLPVISCALHKLVWVFVGAVPLHRCSLLVDSVLPNTSASFSLSSDILSVSAPLSSSSSTSSSSSFPFDSCRRFASNATSSDLASVPRNEWSLVLHNWTSSSSTEKCTSWIYDKSLYVDSVTSDFNLICDRSWQRALVQSLFMAGELVGSVVAGSISDKFGRRRVFFASVVLQAIFGLLCGLVWNYYLFLLFRALVGLVTPGVFLVGYVIGLELVGPSKRLFAGIICQFFFATGYLLTALAAYFVRQWHYLQILISLPGLFFLLYWWFIPESARWLLAKKHYKDATLLLRKVAKVNGTKLPDDFDAPDLLESSQEKDNPVLLFRYPNLRKKSLIIFFNWFVNSGVYYGLALNTSNLGGNDFVNFVIAAALEFPAYTFCLLALNRFGRRIPLCGSMIVAGVALIIPSFIPKDCVTLFITLAMIGKLGITISYAVIYIFSAEQYPTVVRNVGMGMSSTCARIGGILAPFVVLLADLWPALPLIVFGIASLLAGFLALLLPETRGVNLPDTLEEGEKLNSAA